MTYAKQNLGPKDHSPVTELMARNGRQRRPTRKSARARLAMKKWVGDFIWEYRLQKAKRARRFPKIAKNTIGLNIRVLVVCIQVHWRPWVVLELLQVKGMSRWARNWAWLGIRHGDSGGIVEFRKPIVKGYSQIANLFFISLVTD